MPASLAAEGDGDISFVAHIEDSLHELVAKYREAGFVTAESIRHGGLQSIHPIPPPSSSPSTPVTFRDYPSG